GWSRRGPRLLRVVQVDRRSDRGLSRHSDQGQEQGVRGRARVAAGAGKKQHALWLPEGELPVGGLRANHDAGQCADDPRHFSDEASQAFQAVRLWNENKESSSMTSRPTRMMWLSVVAVALAASFAARSGETQQAGPTPQE